MLPQLRLAVLLGLFFPTLIYPPSSHSKPALKLNPAPIEAALKYVPPSFPDMTANYHKYIADKTACESTGGVFSSGGCYVPPPPPAPPPLVYTPPPEAAGLIGQVGWSLAGGNCVEMAIAYGKNQPGNPSSWYATTARPFIGAAALFYFNHVGVVVGIWGNGDLEIAQENAPGMPHRLPPSEFRGFF